MYEVVSVLHVSGKYGVQLKGDSSLITVGMQLVDERQNVFTVESIGLIRFQNPDDFKNNIEVILTGPTDQLGKHLFIR